MEKVLDILKLAIEKEHVRRDAYLDAAKATNNPLAKATFEALARDEDKHSEYLRAYYDSQTRNAGWPAVGEIVEDEGGLEAVKMIFKYANEQIAQAGACDEDLGEVYEAAIAAETESIHLYRDAMEHTTDQNARDFFALLVDVENRHLKLLSETQEFLNDTSKWFFDEEMWIVEG
ncbi:MAG: ferritin family protein [Armatimonadota bacterium]